MKRKRDKMECNQGWCLWIYVLRVQTMGGNFTTKGQQNSSNGIYVLAGKWNLGLDRLYT